MSRKNSVLVKHVDAEDMSSNITSASIECRNMEFMTFQFIFTGTPTGTFTVEASLDGTNWTALGLATISASGAAGNHLVDLYNVNYQYIRTKYTASSGSGSLDVWYKGRY